MKLLILFPLILLIGCSSAKKVFVQEEQKQTAQKVQLQTEKAKIIKYNQLINEADYAILDSNPALAVQLYRQAFSGQEFGYIQPYFNAYRASVEVGDCDMSFFAAKELLKFGAWITHFQKVPCLLDDDVLWTQLEDTYMSSIADDGYVKQFRGLSFGLLMRCVRFPAKIQFLLDSAAHKSPIDSFDYTGFFPRTDLSQYPIPNVDISEIDSLSKIFIGLVDRYGFPSERSIGAEWSEAGITFTKYAPFSLIYHRNKEVRTIFDNAFEAGFISAGQYASISLAEQVCINSIFWLEGEGPFGFDFSKKELAKINLTRQSIGLPSIEKQIATKKLFGTIPPDDDYFYTWLGNLHFFLQSKPPHTYRLMKSW